MTIDDINTNISFLTKTNTTSFPAADRLIFMNKAYNRVVSLIINADGRWEWDDTNNTDLPIATTTITSGQADFPMAVTHLRIKRIELKTASSGVWVQLKPYDNADYDGQSITAMQSALSGVPDSYDAQGTQLFLLPVPNYTLAAGLKIYYERGPAEFTSAELTAGTKAPGFNSLYHALIPLWVAYDYAIANALATANGFMTEIQRMEAKLVEDYGARDKDDPAQLTMNRPRAFK